MATVHEERIRIRWRDVDNYGHVNNAVYLTYLEEARDGWVRSVVGERFNFVIVRIEIDFRNELALEDGEVTIRCEGVGCGRSSIMTREQVRTRDGIVAAEAGSVIAAHDAATRRARQLTDRERSLLDAAIGDGGGSDRGELSPA
jgi:acyl-CoA thioester hydrolase